MNTLEQVRAVARYSNIVAALRAQGYDLLEHEGVPNLRSATVLRKGWMFVGTVTPIGDFGSAELVLHAHNNVPADMAAVVVALSA